MYINFGIVDGQHAYGESPAPMRMVSSFDPQLFANIDDYAEALLNGNGYSLHKYTPVECAQWLEDFSRTGSMCLESARSTVADPNAPAFRRLYIDTAIQCRLGLFFGCKFRSAVLWSIYRKTNDPEAKSAALEKYRSARQAWIELAELASVYKRLTYGTSSGHWSDRIEGITRDIDAMEAAAFSSVTDITTHPGEAASAIAAALGRPTRPDAGTVHTPPERFNPETSLPLFVRVDHAVIAVQLYYRHVNQAEPWQSVEMTRTGDGFRADIPAEYARTIYPLQYYFGVSKGKAGDTIVPGFDGLLASQPYYVVRSVLRS